MQHWCNVGNMKSHDTKRFPNARPVTNNTVNNTVHTFLYHNRQRIPITQHLPGGVDTSKNVVTLGCSSVLISSMYSFRKDFIDHRLMKSLSPNEIYEKSPLLRFLLAGIFPIHSGAPDFQLKL